MINYDYDDPLLSNRGWSPFSDNVCLKHGMAAAVVACVLGASCRKRNSKWTGMTNQDIRDKVGLGLTTVKRSLVVLAKANLLWVKTRAGGYGIERRVYLSKAAYLNSSWSDYS